MMDKRIADNRRYNTERKAQSDLMKRDIERDKLLEELYREAYDRMQKEIDGFYMRYANREGLSKSEVMKRASEFDVAKFADKAAKAVKEKDFSSGTNDWLKLYNLKMKISRLELLKHELALEIQNLTSDVNEVFDKARQDEYLGEYKRQAGILGISSSGAKKRLESILNADFYGQNFSSRVWGGNGLQATLQGDVFGSLNRIFTDMMGYQKERDRLAKKFETSKYNAQRLLKTEIARINADTQLTMLKENGFTHMIYVAEPKACDICSPLDKLAIPIDEVEKGVNMYPMHPNCRCSSYGHIELEYKDGRSTLDEYEVLKKKPEEDKSYRSVKNEWLKNVDFSKSKVSDQLFWEHDNKKYHVDGHNVVLDYNQKEKDTALWLSRTLGKHVEMVPRVNYPKGISTPDYLVDGMKFDLKEVSGDGKNIIDTASKKAKKQAENIVFDISNTSLTEDKIIDQLEKVYKSGRRGLKIAILKKFDELIDVFEPK